MRYLIRPEGGAALSVVNGLTNATPITLVRRPPANSQS